MPRPTKTEITPLTEEETRAFVQTARQHPLGMLFIVCAALGLRHGETLGLQWSATDLDAGTLAVRQQLQKVGKAWTVVPLKTARSRRLLQLPPELIDDLRQHGRAQLEQRMKVGQLWKDRHRRYLARPRPLGPGITGKIYAHLSDGTRATAAAAMK